MKTEENDKPCLLERALLALAIIGIASVFVGIAVWLIDNNDEEQTQQNIEWHQEAVENNGMPE